VSIATRAIVRKYMCPQSVQSVLVSIATHADVGTDNPPSAVTASHLAPPPGYHVAACQVCSEVILTSKAFGGQHTCCRLAGKFGVPGVKGKAPAMPSLYYFNDDPALRVCD
jgi:hypothetical protein